MTAVSDKTEIRVLSTHQPYASAFFDKRPGRAKWCENRTWEPGGGYRGRIYIHASKLERPPSVNALAEVASQSTDPESLADSIMAMWEKPPPFGLPVGQIIGSVNLWEIIPSETLELLSLVPKGAKKLPRDVAACLRPSERDGFLEKWQHVRERIAKLEEVHFLTHFDGPLCWLVDQPKMLREPIVTGGKLNLWKL